MIFFPGPQLLKLLQTVIKNPKPRSHRWLSTSIPQKDWNEDLAKYCSAEYQTNNLLVSHHCGLFPSFQIFFTLR